ncbi:MAG: cyclic nucleotide-binding domain-containing protein [Gammaproteobacteria bacterium]|nr:cyclic nucleotide-binding domain-containing protein [Gammaproteobacteria bacterium]
MLPENSFLAENLTSEHLDAIKQRSIKWKIKDDRDIFIEGDYADNIYFIESGKVSIFIKKFTSKEEICCLGPGEFFGEMAFFSGGQRSASATAVADTALRSIDKSAFFDLLHEDEGFAQTISDMLIRRSEELAIKENVFDSFCSDDRVFHLGIKGDPSLRESAFTREKYQSVVDNILPSLQGSLYDLLVNRSVCEFVIHFNSGEVQIRTVFDPFTNEVHPANKLLNKAYVERHFPLIEYENKVHIIHRLYKTIAEDESLEGLPTPIKDGVESHHKSWQPIRLQEIAETISKLVLLRKIPNFYLRNFTISIGKHAIRMQFNCDGTHMLSPDGLQEFLEQNLLEEDDYTDTHPDRRSSQQRKVETSTTELESTIERRCPPGRRQEDWQKLC